MSATPCGDMITHHERQHRLPYTHRLVSQGHLPTWESGPWETRTFTCCASSRVGARIKTCDCVTERPMHSHRFHLLSWKSGSTHNGSLSPLQPGLVLDVNYAWKHVLHTRTIHHINSIIHNLQLQWKSRISPQLHTNGHQRLHS